MYSRYKAFIFLSGLIFAVIGLVAYLQTRTPVANLPGAAPVKSATQNKPVFVAMKNADGAVLPAADMTGEIQANWRDDIGVPVLCYHQIVTDEKYRERPTPYAVSVKQFREQMEWLAQNNFYTILPDELLAYVRGQKKLDFSNGRKPIVLTFDDGNNDFIHHAQKILDQHGYKGVLFIYPTYIFAHKPRSLTWQQIRSVREAGHAIESHTMWHPMLNTMNETELRAQFADSKKQLDTKAGANVQHLAYPFGIYTAKSISLLKELGYQSAYTTFHGGNQIGENPYLLRRFLIVKSDNGKIFANKTLARSLPLRLLNSEPGAIVESETVMKLGLPKDLITENFKVRIFSTRQDFVYDPKRGEMTVSARPSKKRLSVLEIVYRENGIEYRANALLNHKRHGIVAATGKKIRKQKHKKRRKKKREET